MIAEPVPEKRDTAFVDGIIFYLDAEVDERMVFYTEIGKRYKRKLFAVHRAVILIDPQMFEETILAQVVIPPVGRIETAYIREISRTCPCADRNLIDQKRNIAGPYIIRIRKFGSYLHADLQHLQVLPLFQCIWDLVFYKTLGKPQERCIYSVRQYEREWIIQLPYYLRSGGKATGWGYLEISIMSQRDLECMLGEGVVDFLSEM